MKQFYSEEQVTKKLTEQGVTSGSIIQLYDFGKFLLSEAERLSASIDSKLSTYLSWASALLGFVLLGTILRTESVLVRVLTLPVAILGIATLIVGYSGLRNVRRPAQDQHDWFFDLSLTDAADLRRHQVVGLLKAHQEVQRENIKKLQRMHFVELLLMSAGIFAGVKLLVDGLGWLLQ